MGFDIAYHAIKKKVFTEELVPYLNGERQNIALLINQIARVRINRFIANDFIEEITGYAKHVENTNIYAIIKDKLLQKNQILLFLCSYYYSF